LRVLLLATDAFGGHGGIALYNRDLAEALSQLPYVTEVVVLVRNMPFEPGVIPEKVTFVPAAAHGKWSYVRSAARSMRSGRYGLVICGHINLLPLAVLASALVRAPLTLLVYGIDVWKPAGMVARLALQCVRSIWSISEVTRERMNDWAKLDDSRFQILPNAIHLDRYLPGPKAPDLLHRFNLHGKQVILTLCRLSASERYKGVDELIEAMPQLLAHLPELRYVIAGNGDDVPRLQRKVADMAMQERIIFAGLVDEDRKADYFRLADVFAMPGRGEGFGFVFLEALACGIPCVGSLVDGSREALRNGLLGQLVDPDDIESIRSAIVQALTQPKAVPEGINYFAWPMFVARTDAAARAATAET
jgi:phosphatidyl-myo-inositol dimannoside synthase